MKGKQGNALEHKIAQQTEALSPAHNFVPWIVVDGQHTDAIQNGVRSNLLGYACANSNSQWKSKVCTGQNLEVDYETEMEVSYKDEDFANFIY
jgi:hypothetical protein